MNRRITLLLASVTLLSVASFQSAFAQSDPHLGVWQLNLAKSKYSPGPPPKSATVYIQGEGQNRKVTSVTIDAAGNPIVLPPAEFTDDGKPNAVTGADSYDTAVRTRVDAYTFNVSRTKAGKVVQTGTNVVSRDGKTMTITIAGTDANGRQINNVAVYDKQ